MRVLPAGDRALLAELGSLKEVLDTFQRLAPRRPSGVADIVPAARTLLVRFDPDEIAASSVTAWLRSHAQPVDSDLSGPESSSASPPRVEIPVHYTGEDLDEVARTVGLSRQELIERHTGRDFLAAFAGFAPGFVYLADGDPCFQGIARRAVPRVRVPAGSVAVAGGYGAVYPSDSPGGWLLLGTTPLRMWDLRRQPPALVQPGFRVRFRDLAALGTHYSLPGTGAGVAPESSVEACPGLSEAARESAVEARPDPPKAATNPVVGGGSNPCVTAPESGVWWEVLEPGLQTLVQDLGRPGLTTLGVSASGALDRSAMASANRLVGNPVGTAVLENARGGLSLICHGRAVVAVTGAPVSVVVSTSSGMRLPAATGNRLVVEDGQTLKLGQPRAGMRCYLAVHGGWDVPPVLGSRATDVLAGIGPAPLRKGDWLRVAEPRDEARRSDAEARAGNAGRALARPAGGRSDPQPGESRNGQIPAARLPAVDARSYPRSGDTVWLNIILGPRDDWFDAASLARLEDQVWTVTPQSNRVGLRLAGTQPLARRRAGELTSEGMVAGALEVPPSGQPVLFLADHPLTGGYPVIAVVADRDLDTLAQVPPGVRLRFRVARKAPAPG
ncbi:hypothetical protein CDEF62S_04650 [Castellaniella defragrans]